MAEIRIESKLVGAGAGHLYLVFVSDVGIEYVIRGGLNRPLFSGG